MKIFDKNFERLQLATVIDSVQVYSEERIEIVWKMDDWFFEGKAVEKKVLALK